MNRTTNYTNTLKAIILLTLSLFGSQSIGSQGLQILVQNQSAQPTNFKKFMYRVVGNCSEKGGFNFQYLSTFKNYINIADSKEGVKRVADLSIFLSPNGNYKANYVKMKFNPDSVLGGIRHDQEAFSQRTLEGNAYVNLEGKLILEGVGNLELDVNDSNSLKLKIENESLNEGFVNQTVQMSLVLGTSGINGETISCN